jgi:TolA-binding protein
MIDRRGRAVAALLLSFLLLAGCRETVRTADQYYAARDYERSADEYRRFIRENPKSSQLPDAYMGLGWSEYQRGHYDEAAEAVEMMRGRYPGHRLEATAAYLHAMTFFALRRYAEASNELRDTIRDFADDPIIPEVRYLLARTEAALLRHASAAEQFRIYLEKHGTGPYAGAALLARAESLARIARWQEAAEAYEAYLKKFPRHPDRPQALRDLARVREAYGDYDAARPLWEELVEGDNAALRREALEGLAHLNDVTARPAAAAEARRGLLNLLTPGDDTAAPELLAWLARYHSARAETALAMRYYERLAREWEREPARHAEALEWMAVRELEAGRREAAMTAALRFLERYPQHRDADHMERLVIDQYVAAGRVSDGAARLETLLHRRWAIAPPGDFYRLASLKMEMRDFKGALKDAREGLARARGRSDTPAILSGLYHSMILLNLDGNLPQAMYHWWQLRDLSPHYVTAEEKVYWETEEEKFYAANRIPPERRGPAALLAPRRITVHVSGFDWTYGDIPAMQLSRSLSTLFATQIAARLDMGYVSRNEVRFADELMKRSDYARVPDTYFPLRSQIGADWIVGGVLRSVQDNPDDPKEVELRLKLLRIDYEGVFPFEYVYRFPAEDIAVAGQPVARETVEKLRLYQPDR